MSFLINTNTTAQNAAYNLGVNQNALQNDISHLSSGLRINSAADDAAGLVISNSLSAQSAGLTQATRNTNDAINVVKTAGSALGQVNTLLTNIRQLILHAANVGANNTTAAKADQQAIEQAVNSIQRIALTTQFNGKNLLQGDGAGSGTATNGTLGLLFQVGANGGQTVNVSVNDASVYTLGSSTSAYYGTDGKIPPWRRQPGLPDQHGHPRPGRHGHHRHRAAEGPGGRGPGHPGRLLPPGQPGRGPVQRAADERAEPGDGAAQHGLPR